MKNYLVVGGSSGIGLAIVQQLAVSGNQILVLSREPRETASIAGVSHYSVDIGQDTPAFPNIDIPLDGLVYCPGTINLKPFSSLKDVDFLNDYQINVLGAVKTLRKYLPNLKAAGAPSVVLFSTVAASTGMAFHASVASAKGAVEGLVRSLAAEWAPDIRINAIAPSLTNTPLAARLLANEARVQQATERNPLRKIGQPEDISGMAAFLLSESSRWITGQVFHIDGGMGVLK
ncbi:MAG: SDR family oxidoreductase [Bacteroidia bacterium]